MVKTSYYAVLMNFNKGETAVHGCHCPADMAVCTRKVLARPWVGVFVPLALRLRYYYYYYYYYYYLHHHHDHYYLYMNAYCSLLFVRPSLALKAIL